MIRTAVTIVKRPESVAGDANNAALKGRRANAKENVQIVIAYPGLLVLRNIVATFLAFEIDGDRWNPAKER